ncbi:MAG: aldehyde dehydrogenase family protein [Bacteroidota bacterium]
MEYRSYDPYRQLLLNQFPVDDNIEPLGFSMAFTEWKALGLEGRMDCFSKLAIELERSTEEAARLITAEMGKPVVESRQELMKCINAINSLLLIAPNVLENRIIKSEARHSFIKAEPLGLLLAVMPWNFPFWQVLRFAVPNMLAGNTVLLKHAPNVPGCAMLLQQIFERAGFPPLVFTNRYFSAHGVSTLLSDRLISGFAFTGSDRTGSLLGGIAGQALKKSVMEMGGNDPMIVFEDADIDESVSAAVASRCINGGQTCNGAKRFIVQHSIHDMFVKKLIEKVSGLKIGDPMNETNHIGPIARFDLLERLREQFLISVSDGAHVAYIADLDEDSGWFFPPAVLTGVLPGMTAFEEEIFGPVWSVSRFDTEEDAVHLANLSRYGLGSSIWTDDDQRIERLVNRLETGNVFINDFVRSDPSFPFGGVKRSGYGKDLGEQGFLEFVNWKTVYRKY